MTKLKTLCISSEDSRYYFETWNESIGDGSITTIEPLSELSNATKHQFNIYVLVEIK